MRFTGHKSEQHPPNSLLASGYLTSTPSECEAAIAKAKAGCSLVLRRVQCYDPDTFMHSMRDEYEESPIVGLGSQIVQPSRRWIYEHFNQLVLTRQTPPTPAESCPSPWKDNNAKRFESDDLIFRYMEQCQSQLPYAGSIEKIISRTDLSIAQRVLRIMCDRRVGNANNTTQFDSLVDILDSKVTLAYSQQLPLQFVVPAFPFKSRNQFRALGSPDHLDLGELALMVRLHALSSALSRVYPFGVEWIIVSDGTLFAPVFEVPNHLVFRYLANLRYYRNRLNLRHSIHIVDLFEMANALGPNGYAQFESVLVGISSELRYLARHGKIETSLTILSRSLRWHTSIQSLLKRNDRQTAWLILNDDIAKLPAGLMNAVTRRTRKIAIEYASYALTSAYLSMTEMLLPHAIRATINVKPGQVAIPRLGEVYPWNGAPVLVDRSFDADSIEIRPIHKLVDTGRFTPVYATGNDQAPFFFEQVK